METKRDNGAPAFLSLLAREDRARLEEDGEQCTFAFGQAIVRQGEAADCIYVLLSGQARVVQQDHASDGNGQENILALLQAGDVVGEIGFIEQAPRTATVRASSKVTALRFRRAQVDKLVKERPAIGHWLQNCARGRVMFGFIKHVPAFKRLPESVVWDMIRALKPKEVDSGSQVVIEGDAPGPMYIVEQGRLCVSKLDPNGNPQNLAYLRDGDFFGEASLLRREPRSATVESMTPAKLFVLDSSSFQALLDRWPEFRRAVEERIATFDYKNEARVPLDFDIENVQKARPIEAPKETAAEVDDPFATADGKFVKKRARRSFPFVYQVDEMDCGVACLAMICRYFGRRVSLARIRLLANTETDGTSLGNLCRAATELGLAARAVKVSQRNLDRMPLPALVHWENYHWVVLVDVRRKKVRIADPGVGDRWIPREEFLSKWNGFSGLFDYTDAFKKAPEESKSFGWIKSFAKPYAGVLLQSLGLAVIGAGLTLLLPILTQVVVDRVVVEGAVHVLSLVLLAMGATFFFLMISSVLQGYLLAFAAVRIDTAALDFLTRKLLALPMKYFQTRRTGDIQRRLDGARQIRQLLVSSGVSGLLAAIQFIVAVLVMTVYSPTLTIVYAAVAPLYAGLLFFSTRVLRPIFERLEESHGKYRSEQLDAIKGIEAVKAAGAETVFRDKLLERFLGTATQQFSADFTLLAYKSTAQGVGFLASLLFLWLGARMTMAGEMTLGGFVAFNSLVAMANAPLGTFLTLWDDYQLMRVLNTRLSDVFEQEPEQGIDRSRLLPVRTLAGAVTLRNISFSYGGADDTPILRNIALQVPAGQTVAVVGRSGSGKTTLVKLLSGMIEPTEGAILYDGLELKLLNYRDLRRRIGFVLQDNFLFAGTILENITLGDEPSIDRAISAARMANAHEFIERLPLGYETRVGETGVALSGGQRQRVAIARAIYRNPSVLIFDEATSALDADSERVIQDNLKAFFAGRTVFVIAHRLSTIRDADRILVMEKGEIVEQGKHDELMDRRGLYFYLVSRQVEQ